MGVAGGRRRDGAVPGPLRQPLHDPIHRPGQPKGEAQGTISRPGHSNREEHAWKWGMYKERVSLTIKKCRVTPPGMHQHHYPHIRKLPNWPGIHGTLSGVRAAYCFALAHRYGGHISTDILVENAHFESWIRGQPNYRIQKTELS